MILLNNLFLIERFPLPVMLNYFLVLIIWLFAIALCLESFRLRLFYVMRLGCLFPFWIVIKIFTHFKADPLVHPTLSTLQSFLTILYLKYLVWTLLILTRLF